MSVELTPAYLLDEGVLKSQTALLRRHLSSACSFSYPLKTQFMVPVLEVLADLADGFSASSLFEAKLARQVGGSEKEVQFTSPTLRPQDAEELAGVAHRIAFNSLSQFDRFKGVFAGRLGMGLRVDPGVSFIPDERYNPCRAGSKLGAALADVQTLLKAQPREARKLEGILFHNNCESEDFQHLRQTAQAVVSALGPWLKDLAWINLGGGYLFDEETDFTPLTETIALFRQATPARLFFEPGKGIVGPSMALVASVVDLIEKGSRQVAVLDTSVNHLPEVFEYQTHPPVRGELPEGGHRYQLVGATCLAGDLFGEYGFPEPLTVGSRIFFEEVGAYSFVKAHYFNGVNLPAVYAAAPGGGAQLKKQYSYEEFVSRCGGLIHANC